MNERKTYQALDSNKHIRRFSATSLKDARAYAFSYGWDPNSVKEQKVKTTGATSGNKGASPFK